MKTILVAGATGYLGRFLVIEFARRGWNVRALVRDRQRAEELGISPHDLVEKEATDPTSLWGCMDGVDAVISALGITRQRDGLTYRDVDFQANANLLEAALDAGVERFAYVHVLNAAQMLNVEPVRAKQDFVDRLRDAPIESTIVSPGGYFSDLGDFLAMARSGVVFLLGNGRMRLNPIHGADLAVVCADAVEQGRPSVDVGGPEIFAQDQIAELAFAALEKKPRIVHLPEWLGGAALKTLETFTSVKTYGPIQFFLAVLRLDMVAPCHGHRTLGEHFARLAGAK